LKSNEHTRTNQASHEGYEGQPRRVSQTYEHQPRRRDSAIQNEFNYRQDSRDMRSDRRKDQGRDNYEREVNFAARPKQSKLIYFNFPSTREGEEMEKRELKFRMWDGRNFIRIHDHFTFWDGRNLETNQDFLVLQQFTGLKDKNGVEIFEGDIAECVTKFEPVRKFRAVVSWQTFRGCWAIGLKHANDDLWKYCQNGVTCKVIGNIFENPDLISAESVANTAT
jgi:uncharacterized phage protein (TIGR01671 family)